MPLPDGLDGEALRDRFHRQAERSGSQAQPDWDAIVAGHRAARCRRRVGMTRRQLWRTYCDEVLLQGGEAYGYSQFCTLLNRRLGGQDARTEMRFDYGPGLYGMADFSGKTLAPRTAAGPVDTEIFVAVRSGRSRVRERVTNLYSQRNQFQTRLHRRPFRCLLAISAVLALRSRVCPVRISFLVQAKAQRVWLFSIM